MSYDARKRLTGMNSNGSGTSATYVLLPGAGGEAWYWHLVAPILRAEGHEVVAPDLRPATTRPGSPSTRTPWSRRSAIAPT